MNFFQVALNLVLSVFCGGLIGWDREKHHKPAGFKTHTLVSVGSALFMMISIYIHETYKMDGPSDPGRIAAQVVTGIGFLGAGTIWMSKNAVHGLSTAASLWTVAGVGMAVGCGFYHGAILTTVTILVVFRVLQRVEDHLRHEFPDLRQEDDPSDSESTTGNPFPRV